MQTRTYQTLDRDFLIKQNRKLRMELKQSNHIKQLHQHALMAMNQQLAQSKIIPTLIQIINQTSKSQKIHQLNDKIINLEANLMVLEKIASQTQQNEKQTYNLLADQFQKLKQQNTKKQQQLHKFYQKIGQVDYISGLVTKYKQIISTTQQAMAFKKQQQQLLDALNLQQQMIKKLQQQKDKLLKINVHMKQQVEKRKDQVRNMTLILMSDVNEQNDVVNTSNMLDDLNVVDIDGSGGNSQENRGSSNSIPRQGSFKKLGGNQIEQNGSSSARNAQLGSPKSSQKPHNLSAQQISTSFLSNLSKMNASQFMNNPNNTLNFIRMQRQLLKDVKQQDQMNSSFSVQSDLDCPQLSILFPDKIQKIIKNKQQIKVPFLNMKKVRQMMAKREQKMRKQWQQEKNHMNPTTKIIQLQTQLQITRKQLSNQTLKYRLMSQQLKDLRLKIQQLQKRNQLFTQSNIKLKNNYESSLLQNIKYKQVISQVENVFQSSERLKIDDSRENIKGRLMELIQAKVVKELEEYQRQMDMLQNRHKISESPVERQLRQTNTKQQQNQTTQQKQQQQWQQFQKQQPTPAKISSQKRTLILKKIFHQQSHPSKRQRIRHHSV